MMKVACFAGRGLIAVAHGDAVRLPGQKVPGPGAGERGRGGVSAGSAEDGGLSVQVCVSHLCHLFNSIYMHKMYNIINTSL